MLKLKLSQEIMQGKQITFLDMPGCWRYPNQPHGVMDCPGTEQGSGVVERNHICRLLCLDGSYGGFVFCLGNNIWEDYELVGC